MEKTKNTKRKRLYSLLIIILVVLFLSSTLLLINYWERNRGLFPSHSEYNDISITYDGVKYTPNKDVQGILVLGLDKFDDSVDNSGYYNNQQADFIMLFAVDNKNGTYSAIHLNRDTMAEINVLGVAGEKIDTVTEQLALSHAYGNGKEVSCRNTADAVSNVLNGIPIERYVSVTMDAIPVITDLVGGVEVEVKDDFSEIDDSLVMGEKVVLNGDNVLNFVRTRYGMKDSSNQARMVRQQDYLVSLFEAFEEKVNNDDNFILNASLELSDYIVSNYTLSQLENLVDNLSEYKFEQIYTIEGESKVGDKYMEFYPEDDSVSQVVTKLFYVPEK